MSTEQNKAVVQRIYEELVNQENKAVIDEVFAPDAMIHDPYHGHDAGPRGICAVAQHVRCRVSPSLRHGASESFAR